MARQPTLVRVIKSEVVSQEFRVRVELIDINECSERYPGVKSQLSESDKEICIKPGREEKNREE